MNHMERSAKAEKKKPPTNGASGNEPHPDFGMAVHGRDEGLRSAQPSAAGGLKEDLPVEIFEAYLHSLCNDNKQQGVDLLKGVSDSPHENFDHLTMSEEAVVFPVSDKNGRYVRLAKGIGDGSLDDRLHSRSIELETVYKSLFSSNAPDPGMQMLSLRCFVPVEGVGDMSSPTLKFEGQALPSARAESLFVWFRSHPTVQCKNGNHLQTVQYLKKNGTLQKSVKNALFAGLLVGELRSEIKWHIELHLTAPYDDALFGELLAFPAESVLYFALGRLQAEYAELDLCFKCRLVKISFSVSIGDISTKFISPLVFATEPAWRREGDLFASRFLTSEECPPNISATFYDYGGASVVSPLPKVEKKPRHVHRIHLTSARNSISTMGVALSLSA